MVGPRLLATDVSRARRIEIVGVAGTGKSTLAQTLITRHPDWRLADFIHAREPTHWSYFLRSAPGVVRLLVHSHGQPSLSWDEVKLYVYASEWHRYLDSQHGSGVTLLDQGPVFALACLRWSDSPAGRSPAFTAWTHETTERWASELDAVVELTAADDVLLERINKRAKGHVAKGRSSSEALAVLASHRRAYADVLDEVEQLGRLRRMRVDTSEITSESVADEVLEMLSAQFAIPLDGAAPRAQRERGNTPGIARDGMEDLGSIV